MAKTYTTFGSTSSDLRREELIRMITHSVENLSSAELEAIYYDICLLYTSPSPRDS